MIFSCLGHIMQALKLEWPCGAVMIPAEDFCGYRQRPSVFLIFIYSGHFSTRHTQSSSESLMGLSQKVMCCVAEESFGRCISILNNRGFSQRATDKTIWSWPRGQTSSQSNIFWIFGENLVFFPINLFFKKGTNAFLLQPPSNYFNWV